MQQEGLSLNVLKVDGGMAANDWMLQFLADVLDRPVERPANLETTALGAAYMAGRASGVYGDEAAFAALPRRRIRFMPAACAPLRERLLAGWREAVERTLSSRARRRAQAVRLVKGPC